MTEDGDIPPARRSRDELAAALPELVYGELDDAAAARVRAELAAEPELRAELAGYERVRAALAELVDEDPPPAVSARLLRAAAEAVAAQRPAAGPWARLAAWFRPVMVHPGLAAAASLLLVAGIAGTLFVRHGADIARLPVPTAEPPAPVTVPSAAAAEEEVAAEPAAAAEKEQAAEPAAALAPVGGGAPAAKRSKVASERSRSRPRRRSVEAKDVGGAPAAALDEGRRGKGALGVLDGQLADDVASSAAPPASAAPAGDRAPSSAPSRSPPTDTDRAAELHRQALAAAKAGDCARARKLVAQVRTLAPRYYAASVRGDERLVSRCPELARD